MSLKLLELELVLMFPRPDGNLEPLDKPGGGRGGGYGPRAGRTSNPYASNSGFNAGGRTPFGNTGRTPNPYASNEGRTPAWGISGRTPNPYADSGKTPAWNANARTPNPYASTDGGKTPGWNANSRTPNPYASGGGGSSTWGGATPGRNVAPTGSGSAWGGATPGRMGTNTAWEANEEWQPTRNSGWKSETTPWVSSDIF